MAHLNETIPSVSITRTDITQPVQIVDGKFVELNLVLAKLLGSANINLENFMEKQRLLADEAGFHPATPEDAGY